MEIVVTPDTTYILIDHIYDNRRIYTDGRDWPADIEPSYQGYSIGRWIDEDGDGKYDVLVVETRGFKGPRALETTGLPLHHDNQTIVKERIYFDKAEPGILHDEITVIDNAFTRPWTITKNYRRAGGARPVWREHVCAEHNQHIQIGKRHLFPQRRRPPDADQEGPAAAGSAIFQQDGEVNRGVRIADFVAVVPAQAGTIRRVETMCFSMRGSKARSLWDLATCPHALRFNPHLRRRP